MRLIISKQWKLFTVCTELLRSPYIEHAASGLPNHTRVEVRYDLSRLKTSRCYLWDLPLAVKKLCFSWHVRTLTNGSQILVSFLIFIETTPILYFSVECIGLILELLRLPPHIWMELAWKSQLQEWRCMVLLWITQVYNCIHLISSILKLEHTKPPAS